MCRAIWALAIAPDEDAAARIRRAAGADVQVIAMATSLGDVRERIAESAIDVAILDSSTPDAFGIVSALRRQHPRVAVVWIGQDPPEIVHASVPLAEADIDHLPGVVTRALIAR